MPTAALLVALLAASPPQLDIAVEVPRASALADGRRVLLVVTARNLGGEDLLFLPFALSVTFTGAGARLQRFDEGPPVPPIWLEPRTLPGGKSTRVELVATPADSAWQVPAGASQRANWFLKRPGKYRATVRYAVPEGAVPAHVRLPAGLVWTGELSTGPVTVELAP